jgi:hypothetical protein
MIVFSYSGSKEKQKRNVRMQQGTHSLHINTQDCMSFFRSSRFFFFLFLLFNKASFLGFFSICCVFVFVDRKSLVAVHNVLTTMLYVCVCVSFPGNIDVVPPTLSLIHSIIYRFTCSRFIFLLGEPVYQLACWSLIISCFRKREKVEDDNSFSAQETYSLK